MNSTSLSDYFRSQVMDTNRPYLWSDDEVFTYMNEAQLMFCRLTEGIPDATTPEVVEIPIITGSITAETHPSILHFRTAILRSTGMPLDIKNHTDVKKWENKVGPITYMIIGMEKNYVRWNMTPARDDDVDLLVYRLPLNDITDADQELEIEPVHHASLLFWMKHLCYAKQDAETFDPAASAKSEAEFRAYCAAARIEQERYKHKPRSVAYGGI